MQLQANLTDRTITGLMLPFGEVGRTNLGGVTATDASAVELAADIVLNLEHDPVRPVGKITSPPEVTDAGLVATFRVAQTTAGNDLLAEVAEGLRTGLSVEIANPVVRAGKLLGGLLTGCAAVVAPAFDSARIMTAADTGDIPEEGTTSEEPEDTTNQGTEPEEDTTMTETTTPTTEPLAASAPAGGIATMRSAAPKVKTAQDLFASLAKAHATGDRQLLAALDQTIYSDAQATVPPAWTGEIWAERSHVQKYLPLFRKEALTALKIIGWEFDVRSSGAAPRPLATPTVGDYAGYPAEPVSTEVKTKAVEIAAQRWAGANAFDRALVDFAHEGFWSGYYREMADDLSRKLDAAAEAHMLTAANYTAVTGGTVPSGISTAAAYIVDGVSKVAEFAVPDFAVIGADLWRQFVLTRKEDALEYLSGAVGLDPAEGRLAEFKFIPSTHASLTGKVLVGASQGHVFYGEKTVRVDTVNIGTGGIEHGVFTYGAFHTKSPKAFALVASA